MDKKIIIAGLGCGRKGDITLRTIDELKRADKVFLRTIALQMSIRGPYGV